MLYSHELNVRTTIVVVVLLVIVGIYQGINLLLRATFFAAGETFCCVCSFAVSARKKIGALIFECASETIFFFLKLIFII